MRRVFCVLAIVFVVFGIEIEYELERGWNMLAVPLESADTLISHIFPIIPPAYRYNTETMEYVGIYGLPDPKAGFWMLVEHDTTVILDMNSPWGIDSSDASVGSFSVIEPGCIDSLSVLRKIDDGFLFMTTTTYESPTGGDVSAMTLIKLDFEGDAMWGRVYNLATCRAMTVTDDGDILVAGKLNTWSSDVFCARLDSDGESIWSWSFSSTMGAGNMELLSLDDDNGLLIAGSAVIGFDETGDILWSGMTSLPAFGAAADDDGGFLLAVNSSSTEGGLDILRFDEAGDFISGSSFSSGTTQLYNMLRKTDDNGFIVVGLTYTGSIGDLIIVNLSAELTTDWAKIIETDDIHTVIEDMTQTVDGYVFTGCQDDNQLVMRFSTAADIEWTRTISVPGPDDREIGQHINMVPGGILVTGLKNFWDEHNHTTQSLLNTSGQGCFCSDVSLSMTDADMTSTSITAAISTFSVSTTSVAIETSALSVTTSYICR